MPARGFTRNFKPQEMLTEQHVDQIHRGALDVLEVTGVQVESEKARKIYDRMVSRSTTRITGARFRRVWWYSASASAPPAST